MKSLSLNPKKFLVAFLTNQHTEVKIRRAMWGSPDGWPSTLQLLKEICNLVISNGHKGKQNWKKFILEEACQLILFNALSSFLLANILPSFLFFRQKLYLLWMASIVTMRMNASPGLLQAMPNHHSLAGDQGKHGTSIS
jgi:hypothetical protein